MDLSIFFEPLEQLPNTHFSVSSLGSLVQQHRTHFPDWQQADIILLGSRECRAAGEGSGIHLAANEARKQLYQLQAPHDKTNIVDLGNFSPKESPQAYYDMMAYVIYSLIQANKTVIILGGTQDISYGQYLAYEEMEKAVEYVHIDSRLDMDDADIVLNQHSFNHQIFTHQPNYLHHFSNLGYQHYFTRSAQLAALKKLHFGAVRYGDLHHQIQEAEHHLRMADMLSVDMSSVKHADAPAGSKPSPSGFSAMEICQMMRYAGKAYHLNTLSICEWDPLEDIHHQTSALVALMVWYFIEGYYTRPFDFPLENRSNLRLYSVQLHASVESINFYKHPTSDRWWMEVPYQDSLGKQKNARSILVPCSKKDYEKAREDEIPDRWWMIYHKLV